MAGKPTAHPNREQLKFHRSLSIDGLLKTVRGEMKKVSEHRNGTIKYSTDDVLMSGLAVFSLKYPSLLQFDRNKEKPRIRHNLRSLYGVNKAPCDSGLREVCDDVNHYELNSAFTEIINNLYNEEVIKEYSYLNNSYLLSIDGTGHFSSGKINCPECCSKTHRNGDKEYYHQMLGAVIVHPNKKQVFPLFPEAITRQDGYLKNDCETNAFKRLLPEIKKALPEPHFIILQDALSGDAKNVSFIMELGYSYVITVKNTDQVFLYDEIQRKMNNNETTEFEIRGTDGIIRGYRFANNVQLNKSNHDVLINYLDYWEVKDDKTIYSHQWITDIGLTVDNVNAIMQAGRSRRKVENETFNTLKNLGYNLEHNYGHGKKHLSTVFGKLMMLAFLIDQVQEHVCELFKHARRVFSARSALWEEIRGFFRLFNIKSWMDLFLGIIFDWGGGQLKQNTS